MPGEGLLPGEWTAQVIESLGKKPQAFDNDPRAHTLAELTAQVMFDGHAPNINPGIAKHLFRALNGVLLEWERDPVTIGVQELSLFTTNYLQIFTREAESMSDDELEQLGLTYYTVLADFV